MPIIDPSGLDSWETSETVDALGFNIFSSAEAFRDITDGFNGDWRPIGAHYEGEGENDLVEGMMPAVRYGNRVADAGQQADQSLMDLAETLRTLEDDRHTFQEEAAAFNAHYGQTPISELDGTATYTYERLTRRMTSLQTRYGLAIDNCVGDLDRIRPGVLSTASPAATGPGDYAMMGLNAAVFGAFPGMVSGLGTTRVTKIRPHSLRPSTSYHATLFGRHLHFLDPAMAIAADPRGAWAARSNPPSGEGRRRGEGRSPFSRSPLSDPIWEHHQGQSRGLSGMTIGEKAKHFGGQFGRSFADSLPVVGEVRGYRPEAGNPTKHSNNVAVSTGSKTSMFRTVGRGLGTAGTVLTAGLTYREEKQTETARVAAENPELSREEVERKAKVNAGLGTAGRVGSTILASAAVGAAAGTVVPGPGNVVGFVAGLATGIAMEVPIADIDGDGNKDSLSKMAGEGVKKAGEEIGEGAKKAWNFITGG